MNDAPGAPPSLQAPILVIEDEPSVAVMVRKALESRGYAVIPSSSGAEGLSLLERGEFRGVISDFRTPGGINGLEVREWVKENRPELLPRFIFITGDFANRETEELLARSGTPFVEKPFRVQQFISAVEKAIGKP